MALLRSATRLLWNKQGFSLLNIKHYIERVGFRGRGYKLDERTLDELKNTDNRAFGPQWIQTLLSS